MKKVIWLGVAIMVLGTSNAWAQDNSDKGPEWVFGADVGFKPSISLPSIGTADGKNIDVTHEGSQLWAVYGGFKPVGGPTHGWGPEVRGRQFSTHGSASGSTNGPLVMYGVNAQPNVITSSGGSVAFGPQNFMDTSSVGFSQVDILVGHTWGIHNGAFTLSGGASHLKGAVTDSNSDVQQVDISARLPTGTVDPVRIREKYATSSVSSNSVQGWGWTGAIDGEKCVKGGIVFVGRASLTYLPKGDNTATGFFTYIKDVFLVNTVTNAPAQQIAHLNLAPNQTQFSDSSSSSVMSPDLKGLVEYRKLLGEHAALNIGIGVSWTSFNMRQAPAFVSPGSYAVGQGKYQSRTGSYSVISPTFTASFMF